MDGLKLQEDQTAKRKEQLIQQGGPPGIVRIGVYGDQAELLIISSEQSLTKEEIKADLEQSAQINEGSNLREVGTGYCLDVVSLQGLPGVQCEVNHKGRLASVTLIDSEAEHVMQLAEEVLSSWW